MGLMSYHMPNIDCIAREGMLGPGRQQKIEDTGPLTKKCMETIDDDIVQRSADFIERTHNTGKPFFIWVNFAHMNLRTHPKPTSVGSQGAGRTSITM